MLSVNFEYYIYAVAKELEKSADIWRQANPGKVLPLQNMEMYHYQAHAVCNLLSDLTSEALNASS